MFFKTVSSITLQAMGPKTLDGQDPKAKPKTENRQGRALGSGTVPGARRARRLAEFGPPTGVPRSQVDGAALKKAFTFLLHLFCCFCFAKGFLHV
jgi:hypothetical protein